MYPNVPTRREGSEVFPYSVNFVSPKSATCTKRVNFGIMKVTSVTPLKQRRKKRSDFSVYYIKTSTLTTFPRKFLSIRIFAGLISRWM